MKSYLVALIIAASAMPTSAAELTSQYTRLNHDTDCKVVRQAPPGEGDWSDRVCPGVGQTSYVLQSTDGRETVAYGYSERGAMAGFTPFNYANGTVEWRIGLVKGRKAPVAAIHRWYLANGNGDWATQVLVVSKVGGRGGNPGCAIGYVYANEGARANIRARQISEAAASFRCGRDKPVVDRSIHEFVSQN